MRTTRILLTLFLFFGLTLTNCETEETCPPIEGAFFDIQGIGSLVHHYRLSESSSPPLENNATIPFDTYSGLIMRYSVDFLSLTTPPKSNTGLGQLYALSCVQNGEAGSKNEKYENITLVTLNDFNDQYSSGDTINELIRIGYNQTINEFLALQDSNNIDQDALFFGLIEQPTADSKYQVQVTVELNTGEIYSSESNTVEFSN
jgi:hypothetical protein